MKTFTKMALTILAASSLSTVALAAPGDASYGQSVRAHTSSIEAQAHNLNVSVDTNAAFAPSVQASTNNADRADFLQNQLN